MELLRNYGSLLFVLDIYLHFLVKRENTIIPIGVVQYKKTGFYLYTNADCVHFAFQCNYAGGKKMNKTWYHKSQKVKN